MAALLHVKFAGKHADGLIAGCVSRIAKLDERDADRMGVAWRDRPGSRRSA